MMNDIKYHDGITITIFDASDEESSQPIEPNIRNNPYNWTKTRKVFSTILLILFPLVTNLGVSILNPSNSVLAHEFSVDPETVVLTTALFMVGFAVGPLIIGPLSEHVGRKYPLLLGTLLFAIFCIPTAVAKNIETVIVCRFLSGLFGSSALAVVGGAISDIWQSPVNRGIGVDLFTAAAFLGPLLGPICGNYITTSSLGWRWNLWILAISGSSLSAVTYFLLLETYAPLLAKLETRRIRREISSLSQDSVLKQKADFKLDLGAYLLRPWKLMMTEPILVLITIYISFITGLLFLFFAGYPASFGEDRGWAPQTASLSFIPLIGGVFLGVLCNVLYALLVYKRQIAYDSASIIPERRLPPMIVASFVLPAGLFWFAWTSAADRPWAAQMFSGIPIGASMIVILMQGFKYIVDLYLSCANSAMALNTFARSSVGATFPFFASALYRNLGVKWASILLGCISAGLAPIPLVFFILGPRIRAMSRTIT
ncbi:major facilitator superfamily domain-containing protein [Xylogone sp. PMI_703]|nr:major facilitator superfamily domain-containing protein [Xylogone sp. PMI_703]